MGASAVEGRAALLDRAGDRPPTSDPRTATGEATTIVDVRAPAPRDAWRELLAADPESLPYQSPEWLDAMCEVEGYRDVSRLVIFSDGRRLVLPMVQRTLSGLRAWSSQPEAWGMGGAVADAGVDERHLGALFDELARERPLRCRIRPNPRLGSTWADACPDGVARQEGLAHVLDLRGGFETVWSQRFTKTTRRSVRRAERLGVVVESAAGDRLVPIFHSLYLRSLDRWAEQQNEPRALARWRGRRRDPLSKFQAIARNLGDQCRFWVAWHDDTPVAASMVLTGRNVNDCRAVMDKERAGPVRAGDLILKHSIEAACAAGCHYYHLGESGSSSGLADYKARFGGEATPYETYLMERLPLTRLDRALRGTVKRIIRFEDLT